jgi:hypothetical protein
MENDIGKTDGLIAPYNPKILQSYNPYQARSIFRPPFDIAS